MSPADFRAWRERLELTVTAAAELLGLSVRSIQNYERGRYHVPQYVGLACIAIEELPRIKRELDEALRRVLELERAAS